MSTWHGLRVTKKLFFSAAAFFLISSFMSNFSLAQFSIATFWSKHVFTIRFTTATQNLLSGNCSGVATVQTYTPQGVVYNVLLDTTVSLNAPVTTNFFSDSTCTTVISNITISAGTNSRSFYFTDDSVGTVTLSAAATGFKTGVQNETISANPFVWTGAGGNNAWSTAGNWSGGVAPTSSDRALFNGICSTNCSPTISSSINVGGVRVAGTYAGIITQAAGQTISVQGYGWSQIAGTFTGANSAFTVVGPFGLGGGTFTSTSASLTVTQHFNVSNSPTFNANGGTYVIGNGYKIITPGSINFNNVTLAGGAYDYTTIIGTMNISGTLASSSNDNRSSLDGGTIALTGDLKFDNYGFTGTATIKLLGSTTQNIAASVGTPHFPKVEIASTGGTVNFANSFNVFGSFTYTSGSVAVATGSTITFVGYGFGRSITPGPINFYNVSFKNGAYDNIILSGTMNVLNSLTFQSSDGRSSISGGTISVKGNIFAATPYIIGSVLLKLTGSGNQTVSGTNSYTLPSIEIASTGGTVTFANSFTVFGSFLYTSGTVDMGTTTQTFTTDQFINSGPVNFYNLTFANGAYQYMSINGTVHILNNLTFASTDGRSSVDSGTSGLLSVGKDMTITTNLNNGNVPIEFVGTSVQKISSVGGSSLQGNRTVNSASSILTLDSNMSFTGGGQTFTVAAGSVDMAGYNLNVRSLSLNSNTLTKNGGILTVNGSTAGTGSLYGGTVNP